MSVTIERSPFRTLEHRADLCVVGGGMAGLCAAVAAARHGATVVLMQDRPVLGGNASGEIGVHILGADRNGFIPFARETGILEELRLENLRRNPQASLGYWDLVVYNFVRHTPGLTLLLNCSCLDAAMAGSTRIASVTGWQLSTQTWHRVHARIFADCSGDGILAPLTGAEHRMGREAAGEFAESFAPAEADPRTMGMSYIYYARPHEQALPYVPFGWEREFKDCNALPWGAGNHAGLSCSPWWCELGGEYHPIHDSERLRDELFAFNLGLWNHIKNGTCEHRERARNWALERISFVPGRRESRRYAGLHMLSQGEIAAGGRFPDAVCHGGWTMDDHHPGGGDAFAKYGQPPTIHHPAPSPYGIPYRCLVAKTIENLMFAGRVASCTHIAMSSTRVMGTCAVMGQALGTAAALACRKGIPPAGVLEHIGELQQTLLADDVFIPDIQQDVCETTRRARLEASNGADPEPVRDGVNRPVSDDPFVWQRKRAWTRATDEDLAAFDMHGWLAAPGDHVAYRFPQATRITEVTLILDSNLDQGFKHPGTRQPLPDRLPRSFRIEALRAHGWETVAQVTDNVRRQVTLALNETTAGLRLVLEETRGAPQSRVYGLMVRGAEAPGA
jgi:hypothetical protein